jgi:hypothetical protein
MHSPYQQLRKGKDVKVDIHLDGAAPARRWIKGAIAAVQVPDDVLQTLNDDIEKRHAGTARPEEILWIQPPRPLKETMRNSWAAGLCICALLVGLFGGIGIGLRAPAWLIGTALVPPILAVALCALLASRIRCDLKGYYVLTKSRAIIVVPRKHFKILPKIVVNFDFTSEKSLIVHKIDQAGIHERILKREPRLCDFFHTKHSTGEVTFFPRTKLQIPFYWSNIQHSHAFETVFNDTVLNSPSPTNGGRVIMEKQNSFAEQKAFSRKYKLYPLFGALWVFLLLASVTIPAWTIWSFELVENKVSAGLVAVAWLSIQTTIFAVVYPFYRYGRAKYEARANGRYMKFMVTK